MSILETIFCEFWSVATTVKKIFDKLCNFIDVRRFLCINSGVNRARPSVKDRTFSRSRASRNRDVATICGYLIFLINGLITYYNSFIQLNYHMFTNNIGTITTVLNLNIYLHCQIVYYIY